MKPNSLIDKRKEIIESMRVSHSAILTYKISIASICENVSMRNSLGVTNHRCRAPLLFIKLETRQNVDLPVFG